MTITANPLEAEFLPLKQDVRPLRAMIPAYPTTNVIAEIKPHTERGIRDGIRQLRGRRPKGPHLMLVTYRPVGRQLLVLVADPTQLRTAINRPDLRPTPVNWTWYTLGHVNFDVNQVINAAQCPPWVGQKAEPMIRQLYWRTLGLKDFRSKSASAPGPDITHEFAAFLAEFETGQDAQLDRILEQLRAELQLRFSGPSDPGLVQRRHRLRILFGSVPQPRARALYARLGRTRTGDPLSQHFHGRLGTATRAELLRILRARFSAQGAAAPTIPPGPAAPNSVPSCR